jgi:acyl-CoA thioesterase-1
MRNLILGMFLSVSAVQADTVVIAALGDSLTAGYGLPTADGFVPQLQAWLDAQGLDVSLRNAGVSGDTTAGGLSRTDWTLTPDVDAMIVTLGGNDYLRGLDPELSQENLRGILTKAQTADVDVLIVGLTAGSNYGLAYKSRFDAMYAELAVEFDVPLVPNFFSGLLEAANVQERVRDYMQSDGIHPNADGVGVIVEVLGPEVAALAQKVAE